MQTTDPILNAAGIRDLPPGVSEYDVLQKVLADSLVGNRVFALLIQRHAAEALRGFRGIELDALHKRVGAIDVTRIKPAITWGIIHPDSDNRQMFITANAAGETVRWNGGVEKLKTFRWRGEAVPEEIAELYRLHNAAPVLSPEAVAERRRIQKDQMDLAQREQNTPRSPEEVEAARAFAKLPFVD